MSAQQNPTPSQLQSAWEVAYSFPSYPLTKERAIEVMAAMTQACWVNGYLPHDHFVDFGVFLPVNEQGRIIPTICAHCDKLAMRSYPHPSPPPRSHNALPAASPELIEAHRVLFECSNNPSERSFAATVQAVKTLCTLGLEYCKQESND